MSQQTTATLEKNERIWFFNVSLKQGHVMSRPIYSSEQALVGDLIRAMEVASPQFAWAQILFRNVDVARDLVMLKNDMIAAKKYIETPKVDILSSKEKERRELYRDWYRKADARIKRLDDLAAKQTVLMAIQGMWVGNDSDLMQLPFNHCADTEDSLVVFRHKDPRILIELVERRMVEDISEYLMRYAGSRLEPPSFLISASSLL